MPTFTRSFDDGPDGLVSLMNGRDTLSGWDVLVSYSGVQLNALLAERAAALKLNSPLTWEAVSSDPLGIVDDRILVFTAQLLTPTLQFIDTSNNVTLTFGLAGSYTAKDMPEFPAVQLPSGLTCELQTSLVNVAGQWNDKGWTPAPGTTTDEAHAHDFVSILEPGASATRGICVDLTKCTMKLGQVAGSGIQSKTLIPLKPLLQSFIEDHFTSHGWQLCLAAVSNNYNVDDKTSQVLQPTQMCFTISGGVLLIWIGLKGGPNTGVSVGALTGLVFSPNSQVVSPIPEGSTASIIFSHNTMVNMFLKPALLASPSVDRGKDVISTTVKTNVGMIFNFTLADNAIVIEKEQREYKGTFGDESSWWVDGCTVNMNEKPVRLNVHCRDAKDEEKDKDDNTPKEPIKWPLGIRWDTDAKRVTSGSSFTSAEGHSSGDYAVANITFSYGGHGTWTASADPVHHPNQLGVTWTLDPTLTLDIKPEAPTTWEKILGAKTEQVPAKYANLRPAAPALDLTLKPLDYFLTTNLLLPGQHVFHADAPAFQSKTSGIAIPRDAILTGRVAPNQGTATAAHLAVQTHRLSLPGAAPEAVFSHMESNTNTKPRATLDDFKAALLGFPSNNLMGEFVQLIDQVKAGAGADEPFAPMLSLLDKHGFRHLAEDGSLMELWGTSLDALYGEGEPAAPEGATSVDLRLYAGYYIVDQPADDQGEQFYVHSHTGAVRMRGKDVTPQQTYDAEKKRVVVTWQLAMGPVTQTYAASFRIIVDKQTYKLGYECVGSVRDSDESEEGDPQPFVAYSKGYKEAEVETEDLVVNASHQVAAFDTSSTVPPLEVEFFYINSDTLADVTSITTVIYSLVYVGTVAVGLAVYCWKTKDLKKKNLAQANLITQLEGERNGLHAFSLGSIEALARTEYGRHGAVVEPALTRLEDRVTETAQAYLESMITDEPHLIADMAADADKLKEVRELIGDHVHNTLKAEIRADLGGAMKTVFDQVVDANPEGRTLNDKQREALLEQFVVADTARTLERLQSQPRAESLRFTEFAGQRSIDAKLLAYTEAAHKLSADAYNAAAAALAQTEIDRGVAEKAKKHAELRAKLSKTEDARKHLQVELDKATEKFNDLNKKAELEREHRDKARVEERAKHNEHRARETEHRTTERHMREKRRHVMGR